MKRIGGAVGGARAMAAFAVSLMVLAVAGGTGQAQTTTTTATTTTSSVPTSTTSTSVAPTTTVSSPSSSGPATQTPSTTIAAGDAEAPTTTDPLVNEGPGETAPETDATVPADPGSYGNQPDFKPQEVLWSSVVAARRKVEGANAQWAAAIGRVREARLGRKAIESHRNELTASSRQAVDDLEAAQVELQARAVAAFVSDEAAGAALIGSVGAADHDEVLGLRVRQVLLDVVLEQDQVAIEDYNRLRARLDRSVVAMVDSLRAAEQRITEATREADQAELLVAQAEDELSAFEAGSSIYISGVVFPIAEPYDLPLIDSYGFPRMPGTPDEHWHEGIDLFAPAGTPLLAAERGVITRISSGRLGGLTFWLRGESGADWYYAHLLSYAPGLRVGDVVEAGQVVGAVGNTGNAISTPAHLHLQLHPGGGEPVNPYPLLKVASDRDLALGVEPGPGSSASSVRPPGPSSAPRGD